MKIKRKYAYTKEKNFKFTKENIALALEKALREHPELIQEATNNEWIKDLTIKTKIDNE